MDYISRASVIDILLKHFWTIDSYEVIKASQEIYSLPSLDPKARIIELIEKKIGKNEFWWIDYSEDYCNFWKELLSEINQL